MFFTRIGNQLLQRRLYSTLPKFTSKPATKPRRWVPYAIFSASFFTGWLVTQHMTFTDLVAYYRYDALPESSEEVQSYQNNLLNRLAKLPVVRQLEECGYTEIFPKRELDDRMIDRNLTSPGGIAIPPKYYYNPKTKDTVAIYHLGMKLTGYPFIIHGGILATVMEDQMRESVRMIKGKKGEMTKELSLSYKLPTFANQFVVVRTTSVEEYGSKVKFGVEVMDQTGNRTLVTGHGTFTV